MSFDALHDNEQYQGIIEALGLCGCVDDEDLVFLRDVMRLVKAWGDSNGEDQRFRDFYQVSIGNRMAVHLLDDAGYIEHGSNIRGSWLTDQGEAALAFLEAVDVESEPPYTLFLHFSFTEQQVETAAATFYQSYNYSTPWNKIVPESREYYLAKARAVLDKLAKPYSKQ